MNRQDLFKLTGKVAIVTGGMRGLGYAMAVNLAKFGADIVIADIEMKTAEKIKKEFTNLNRKLYFIKTDVSNSQDVNHMVKDTINKFGRIDILVNNAGITKRGPSLRMNEKDWDRVITVNLKGVFLYSQAVGKEMKNKRKEKLLMLLP